MKIQVEVEVFPDRQFCCSDAEEPGLIICKYNENGSCWLFFEECKEFHGCLTGSFKYAKCDQCKKAYQEACNK